MSETGYSHGQRIRIIVCAAAIVTLVGVSLSVSGPLLAFEMERWRTPSTVAGITAALSGIGNILTVAFVPYLARVIGVSRLIIGMLLLASALHVAFWLVPNIFVWAGLRFLLGGAIGTLFVLSEYWINAAAPPEKRGLVMGAYATALGLGFAAGPALLAVLGTAGPAPYFATAALILTGLIPLFLIGNAVPMVHGETRTSVLSFVRTAPVATCAAITVGAIEIGLFTQGPIHGLRLGLSEREAALLVSAFALGNTLFQIPFGLLADSIDRRALLLAIGTSGAVLFVSLLGVGGGFIVNAIMMTVLGGLVGALYTVGLAHLGGRFTDIDLVSANAAFVMLYSIGQMTGPPLIGMGIDLWGVKGLPSLAAAMMAAYALLVAYRITRSHGSARNNG